MAAAGRRRGSITTERSESEGYLTSIDICVNSVIPDYDYSSPSFRAPTRNPKECATNKKMPDQVRHDVSILTSIDIDTMLPSFRAPTRNPKECATNKKCRIRSGMTWFFDVNWHWQNTFVSCKMSIEKGAAGKRPALKSKRKWPPQSWMLWAVTSFLLPNCNNANSDEKHDCKKVIYCHRQRPLSRAKNWPPTVWQHLVCILPYMCSVYKPI